MVEFEDIHSLAGYLCKTVQAGNSVILHGFGAFALNRMPAAFSPDSTVLYPPKAKVSFMSDSLFNPEDSGCGAVCIELNKEGEFSDFFRGLKRQLIEDGRLELPGFGKVVFSQSGSFIFEQDAGFLPDPALYGLEPLPLKGKSPVAQDLPAALPERKVKKQFRVLRAAAFAALILAILIVLAVIIFREQLTPLLERLLYSEEELEILRNLG